MIPSLQLPNSKKTAALCTAANLPSLLYQRYPPKRPNPDLAGGITSRLRSASEEAHSVFALEAKRTTVQPQMNGGSEKTKRRQKARFITLKMVNHRHRVELMYQLLCLSPSFASPHRQSPLHRDPRPRYKTPGNKAFQTRHVFSPRKIQIPQRSLRRTLRRRNRTR